MLGMFIAAALAAQPAEIGKTPAACKRGVETVRQKSEGHGRAQTLNTLPNADAYLAVIRMDQRGCSDPIIVRSDIGNAPGSRR